MIVEREINKRPPDGIVTKRRGMGPVRREMSEAQL